METFNIKNLTFSYNGNDNIILDDVSFTVNEGEFVLICGKSGCGKTTLLSHLKPAMSPRGKLTGEILYKGRPLSEPDEISQAKEIGYVMQNPHQQIATNKVWHEIAFGLECIGTDVEEMHRRVADISYFFGIDKWFDRDIRTLSGGQKQLVNLASVMAMQPEVLILDEPTSQLDPIRAQEFLNAVYRINSELGTTVIITEHRTENLFALADRVIFMEDGKILCDGTVAECVKKTDKVLPYLPSSAQIAKRLNHSGEDIPLTIREGREYLKNICNDFSQKDYIADERNRVSKYRVEVKNAYFRYDKNSKDILYNCNVKIPSGCIYAITGGNGAGKSTLVKCISGICTPYSGKINVNGRAVYVPQEAMLLFNCDTVRDELKMMCDDEEIISKIAELCHISALFDNHPYDISAGQQQCVALAKVLLTDADVIVLDEITKGMDIVFKKELAKILRRITDDGRTVIIVSHDVEFCGQYADRIGMFFDGSITGEGSPHEFFSANNFYTTSAARISRGILNGTVNVGDILELCKTNGK